MSQDFGGYASSALSRLGARNFDHDTILLVREAAKLAPLPGTGSGEPISTRRLLIGAFRAGALSDASRELAFFSARVAESPYVSHIKKMAQEFQERTEWEALDHLQDKWFSDNAEKIIRRSITSDRNLSGIDIVRSLVAYPEGRLKNEWRDVGSLESLLNVLPTIEAQNPTAGTSPASTKSQIESSRFESSRERETIPSFDRDTADASAPDILNTAPDVRALSRLVCLRNVTPLAIAILGGWGSGKSTFMERMEIEVNRIADAEVRRQQRQGAGPRDPGFLSRIVQIRFNAWQFVDSNLWASLTAEFFDQLRAGGWRRASGVRHAQLVETVTRHVQALNSEVAARRDELAAGDKALVDARRARDEAAGAVDAAATRIVRRGAVEAIDDLFRSQRQNLTSLGIEVADVDVSTALDAILQVSRDVNSVFGYARAVVRLLASSSQARKLVISALLSALAIAVFVWLRGFTSVQVVSVIVGLGALGNAALAALPAISIVHAVARRAGDIAKEATAAQNTAVKILLQKEIELRQAVTEATTLRAAEVRAREDLSRYVDPTTDSNPPRLLKYLLQDDPNTKSFEKEIGLIARSRRLFQAVDDIVANQLKNHSPGQRLDGDVPERIILYIDDLDRCTVDQVYSVLQAVHLLLAFELFVVVIGMDLRWVQSALARCSSEDPISDGNGEEARQRAVQYLEKIIQIPLWLRPLEWGRAQGGTYDRYVESLGGEVRGANTSQTGAEQKGKRPESGTGPEAAATARADSRPDGGNPDDHGGDEAEIEVELATFLLERAEVDFLASQEIASIASDTPRGVKRMINIYRLVRAHLAESGDHERSSAPEYPLIALAVAVETSQPVAVADALYHGLEAMHGAESLNQAVFWDPAFDEGPDAATLGVRKAIQLCPGLKQALAAVSDARGIPTTAGELLHVSRIARRYSFHAP